LTGFGAGVLTYSNPSVVLCSLFLAHRPNNHSVISPKIINPLPEMNYFCPLAGLIIPRSTPD